MVERMHILVQELVRVQRPVHPVDLRVPTALEVLRHGKGIVHLRYQAHCKRMAHSFRREGGRGARARQKQARLMGSTKWPCLNSGPFIQASEVKIS